MVRKLENEIIDIKSTLSEIDQKPFIHTLTIIVSEVSPLTDLSPIHDIITLVVRCASLLDLYAETGDIVYFAEFSLQENDFYKKIPRQFHPELKRLSITVSQFFIDEKTLLTKIKSGDPLSDYEIEKYLLGKSGDNLFYGRALEILVPKWRLTRELQIQTMLFDIGKDLLDYEQDVKSGLPNILMMYPTRDIAKTKIIQLADKLVSEAMSSTNLNDSPTLKHSIENNYASIMMRLNQ